MFYRCLGMLIIIIGAFASIISFTFNGMNFSISKGSYINSFEELIGGIIISFIVFIIPFFIGKYIYKIGNNLRIQVVNQDNQKNHIPNKLTHLSISLIIIAVIWAITSFPLICYLIGNNCGDGWGIIGVFEFGLLPAGLFVIFALILLSLNHFKEKINKNILKTIFYIISILTILITVTVIYFVLNI